MSDDWEDWEEEDFAPAALKTANAQSEKTKGDLLLAKHKEVDTSKFAGEDEGEEEEPKWKSSIPQTQDKKPVVKKAYENKGVVDQGQVLDDPVAEKLRLAKLQEQSDLNLAKEMMGEEEVDLTNFEPKTSKDFDSLARTVVNKYIQPYEKDAKFKGLLKALMKNALAGSDIQQVRDLETCLAGIRTDKLKEEKAAAAAKKAAGKKKILNVGRSGGSAGLEDYQYDDTVGDDDDFM